MFGSGRNSRYGDNVEPSRFHCEICHHVIFGIEAFTRHSENHFLEEHINGLFNRPSGSVGPYVGVLPPNSAASLPALLSPPTSENSYLSFLTISQPLNPILSAPNQQRLIRPTQPAPAIGALPASQLQIQAPRLHGEHQRRPNIVAPTNSLSSSTGPEVIDLVQSDAEEDIMSASVNANVSEESYEDDLEDTGSSH